jgi:rhodanese-related sulfurtransferase
MSARLEIKLLRNNHVSGFKNITVADLVAMQQKTQIKLIDVRTDAEMARGKIPQGEALPLHLLPLRMHDMQKTATTVFYCQMGGRSAQAAAFAAGNGFTDVYNLQGGITAWAHAGLPLA